MPFQSNTPFDHIVVTLQQLLAAKRAAGVESPTAIKWNHKALYWACRHLEDFMDPAVSVAALDESVQRGLPDPRKVRWGNQIVRLKDPGRKVFRFDHLLPVSEMIRQLEGLGSNPSHGDILRIVEKADVVWILDCEDKELNRLGYRSKRPNPVQAYSEAGIRIAP